MTNFLASLAFAISFTAVTVLCQIADASSRYPAVPIHADHLWGFYVA